MTTTQYRCANDARRGLIQNHPALNGIDYLEVVDHDAPLAKDRQRVLNVFLFKPPAGPLTKQNVRISGGEGVPPIALDGDPQVNGNRVAVKVVAPGDYSTYTLRFVGSATGDAPPPNFDPQLSAIDLSFKVECDTGLDCAPDDDCPPPAYDEPRIDYLAKDYASFRRQMLDRLAVTQPNWLERSPADLRMALVEAIAYVGDELSYLQDSAATEAYLGTARLRSSVRRHARLLDYTLHEGCNARAWIALNAAADFTLRQGAQLLTRISGASVVIEAETVADAVRGGAAVFETMHDLDALIAHNDIALHTWADQDCCLPQGATRATLKDDGKTLKLKIGDALVLEEKLGAQTGLAADRDIAHRHVVRLTRVWATEDPVGQLDPNTLQPIPLDVLEVEWSDDDALPFALRASAVIDGALVENMAAAHGNVVLADHGPTLAPEPLAALPSAGRYRPTPKSWPLIFAAPYQHALATELPAASAIEQDPREALPAIALRDDNGDVWRPRRDLLNTDRFANEFVVEVESDGRARLRFGDGVNGRAPEAGLVAHYRVGGGTAGNVGADAIAHVVNRDGLEQNIASLRNPLPARGGSAPEPMSQARMLAPFAFRHQERAVTEADYAEVAQRHPDVQRAMATRRWTGSWHTMFVTVDRAGGRSVDADFERELREWFARFRLAGHDIEIDAPRFVALDIEMKVCVARGHYAQSIEAALLRAFSSRGGFFDPDSFTFGQSVVLSQAVARAMGLAGVEWVEATKFERWKRGARGEIEAGEIGMGRLEIARCDNDPSAPDHGQIRFVMLT